MLHSMALPASILKMRDLLLRAKVVDEFEMQAALAQLERFGGRLPKVLADMGFSNEEAMTKVIADALRLPLLSMAAIRRDPEALSRLDVRLCEAHTIFPLSLNSRTHTLVLAMAEPTALDVVDLVATQMNARVQTVVASESLIAAAIAKYYYGRAPSTAGPGPNLARRAVTAGLPDEEAPSSFGLDRAASRPTGLSEQDMIRLGSLRSTQVQTSSLVRALRELLVEKGYLD